MEWAWGVTGGIVFVVLTILGVRIGYSSLIAGLISLALIHKNLGIVGTTSALAFFGEISAYEMSVIPLFLWMGYLGEGSGIGADVFKAARCWLGRLPGGLAIAAVLGAAFFGAISGSTVATVVLFSRLAYPEMEKAKYDWKLSLGAIESAGFIDNLIPPSTLMIIYGILTEQSIGKLLVGGFLPGLLGTAVFSTMIIVRCIINPNLGPPGEPKSWREKIISSKNIIPVAIIILIIIGGMYIGIFTPTEAGAWSSFVMLCIIVITMRKVPWSMIGKSLVNTARSTAMVFLMIVGIRVMTTALVSSGALHILVNYMLSLSSDRWILFAITMIFWFILDLFMGTLGQLMMTVPFFVQIGRAHV